MATREWTEVTLYLFQGGTDGDSPEAALYLDSSGALYGTTSNGGGGVAPECDGIDTPVGCGTVFKLTPPSQGQTPWTEAILYSFSGGSDGALPHSRLLVDESGTIYGTTSSGGLCKNGYTICGVVFQLVAPAPGGGSWTESVVYTFPGDRKLAAPLAGLTAGSSGVMYGTTTNGVFQLIPSALRQSTFREKDLFVCKYHEQKKDGYGIQSDVILDSKGNLFGTASTGGNDHDGLVFELLAK